MPRSTDSYVWLSDSFGKYVMDFVLFYFFIYFILGSIFEFYINFLRIIDRYCQPPEA